MVTIDKQRRILLGVDFYESDVIYIHVASLKDKSHIMVSTSEEADWYMLGKCTVDKKNRVVISKPILTFLGWEEGDSLIRAKHLGKLLLIKS